MTRTLLDLVQQAMDEVGMPQPSALFGQVDDQSRQLLALACREGKVSPLWLTLEADGRTFILSILSQQFRVRQIMPYPLTYAIS